MRGNVKSILLRDFGDTEHSFGQVSNGCHIVPSHLNFYGS